MNSKGEKHELTVKLGGDFKFAHFGQMSWPLPDDDLLQTLKFPGELSDHERGMAASILAAYEALIWKTQPQRRLVIKGLRKAIQMRNLALSDYSKP